jgi:hypothetical protein
VSNQRPAATSASYSSFEVLDYRAGDGMEVALIWDRPRNKAVVATLDRGSGHYFEVPVASAQSALDVFHHPTAYHMVHEAVTRPSSLRADGGRHAEHR